MIDYDNMRQVIAKGLSVYLGCPVIRSNQNAEPPAYPYVSYTITTPMSENKGTYEEYEDGTAKQNFVQVWSITILSEDDTQSVELAVKARGWFDFVGTVYLNDNDVIVQTVGSITNRDNVLTIEYEYRKGFDVFFNIADIVDIDYEQIGWIEDVTINETTIHNESAEEGEA